MYLVSYVWVPTIVFVESMIESELWYYQVNGPKIDLILKQLIMKLKQLLQMAWETAKNIHKKSTFLTTIDIGCMEGGATG